MAEGTAPPGRPGYGGYLVAAATWRLTFAINVPFVIITLLPIAVSVPGRQRGAAHAPVDCGT